MLSAGKVKFGQAILFEDGTLNRKTRGGDLPSSRAENGIE